MDRFPETVDDCSEIIKIHKIDLVIQLMIMLRDIHIYGRKRMGNDFFFHKTHIVGSVKKLLSEVRIRVDFQLVFGICIQ